MICLVCLRSDTHRYSCDDCTETTRRRLRELELYAEWLATPTMLAPTRGTTGRRSPPPAARPADARPATARGRQRATT